MNKLSSIDITATTHNTINYILEKSHMEMGNKNELIIKMVEYAKDIKGLLGHYESCGITVDNALNAEELIDENATDRMYEDLNANKTSLIMFLEYTLPRNLISYE